MKTVRCVLLGKELLVVPGASHIDMYDKPEYVPQAVRKLTAFFSEHLK
jgi:fermentation-respiration switch protein FrsA (DUF1100 family)